MDSYLNARKDDDGSSANSESGESYSEEQSFNK